MIALIFGLLSFVAIAETEVKYIRNYDGDTITFDIGKVRLMGVDTAEMNGKKPCEKEMAQIAKKYVENRMKNATKITITNNNKRDIYNRILADVYVDGKNLKEELLKGYYAVPYVPNNKRNINWCRILEKRNESKTF